MNFAWLRKLLRHGYSPNRPRSTDRSDAHLQLGRRGERLAARYLRRRHHRILARNYDIPAGEIDLICAENETLVFVEVKTRSSDQAQDLADAVRFTQWQRIERAARCFLGHPASTDRPVRFDLITVLWPEHGKPVIEHYRDVHQPTWRGIRR